MSAVPNLSDEGDAAHGGGERVALAEALFCPSADMAKVLSEALVLPSVPTVQLVVTAVGRVKEEIYRLLEMAARLEEAARQGERDGDAETGRNRGKRGCEIASGGFEPGIWPLSPSRDDLLCFAHEPARSRSQKLCEPCSCPWRIKGDGRGRGLA